jgi:multidrug resistance efflux pump
MPLKIEKKRVRESLQALQNEVLAAEEALDQAQANIRRLTEALVDTPANAILWRRMAVSGMSVTEGSPVAEWVDCSEILVDMPLSDAEAGLLEIGDQADVILEGETEQRSAEVLLIRGSGSQLDRKELAALAKGRRADTAQVILTLDTVDKDRITCPIGRAAHVDIKGVGLLDIVLARLRF